METIVRRVQPFEWQQVRAFRLTALRDPDAEMAFLDAYGDAEHRDEAFWQARTAGASSGEGAAQFIALSGETWIGTATGLTRVAGSIDHLDRPVSTARVDVVGVYVQPDARGARVIDQLLDAIAEWTRQLGFSELTLDVHVDNVRAQAAYRRNGFVESGARFTGPIGPELEMVRALSS